MSNKKHGFTIIEVVLVLAIAGLIFLMVFVALPALQRSQRDTQRRQDVARVATAITQYQANNGGDIPLPKQAAIDISYDNENGTNAKCSGDKANTKIKKFRCDYLGGEEFKDPNGEEYKLRAVYKKYLLTTSTTNNLIQIIRGVNCDNYTTGIESADPTNDYAIVIKLEGSGTYCLDNK